MTHHTIVGVIARAIDQKILEKTRSGEGWTRADLAEAAFGAMTTAQALAAAPAKVIEAPADVREVAEKAIASWMIDWEPFEQGGYEHRGLIEAIASALSAHGTAQRAAGVEACKNAVCEHCRKNIPICKTWRDFHQYEGFVAQCLAAAIRNGEGTK